MGKRLFLLLLTSFIGIAMNPSFLTADQAPEVKAPEFHAVETIIIEEKPQSTQPEKIITNQQNNISVKQTTFTAPQKVNYTVSYHISTVDQYIATSTSLSYNGLYKFEKMIYGHNTANLLGSLSSRSVGEQFTITEGGTIQNYRVTDIALYRKTADGYLEGNNRLMDNIAFNAMGHDVALLTCAGQSYGNGDASHRLVVFADRI